jgi:hypothetical protein
MCGGYVFSILNGEKPAAAGGGVIMMLSVVDVMHVVWYAAGSMERQTGIAHR